MPADIHSRNAVTSLRVHCMALHGTVVVVVVVVLTHGTRLGASACCCILTALCRSCVHARFMRSCSSHGPPASRVLDSPSSHCQLWLRRRPIPLPRGHCVLAAWKLDTQLADHRLCRRLSRVSSFSPTPSVVTVVGACASASARILFAMMLPCCQR
jgi:hypothetical protein